jgi:thiol-disulfide isomerase/thioredoxin
MPKTRKNRKGGNVLDVRSDGAVKLFEKALVKGPLTLVYVNAKWCGACHRFNDEVWSPLTKLKNKSVNLASVDSEFIGKTSLANVPRKFYPTLMLVGKDGKPATFEDEEGQPTNAMPRNSTLSEDREALSNLVVNPTLKTTLPQRMNSPPRANVNIKSLAKSPFEARNNKSINEIKNMSINKRMGNTGSVGNTETVANTDSVGNTASVDNSPSVSNSPSINSSGSKNTSKSKQILSSIPPNIGADLVASQTKSPTPTAALLPEAIKGGSLGLLDALKRKAASMRSMLQMRTRSTRRNRK